MKPLFGCLLSATLLTTTATVHADTLFDRYFANADGGKPCYTRIYDAQHLRHNPNQKVRQITLVFDVTKPSRDKPMDAQQFEVALSKAHVTMCHSCS
jgi:hypothetical protein